MPVIQAPYTSTPCFVSSCHEPFNPVFAFSLHFYFLIFWLVVPMQSRISQITSYAELSISQWSYVAFNVGRSGFKLFASSWPATPAARGYWWEKNHDVIMHGVRVLQCRIRYKMLNSWEISISQSHSIQKENHDSGFNILIVFGIHDTRSRLQDSWFGNLIMKINLQVSIDIRLTDHDSTGRFGPITITIHDHDSFSDITI